MNPPFERCQDVDHILHAYPMLAPQGTLTAIVSAGVFHRKDKKTQGFRKASRTVQSFRPTTARVTLSRAAER